MAQKQPYFKPLSQEAIGFLPQATKKVNKNGIFEHCEIFYFGAHLKGVNSFIDIKYNKIYSDSQGNKLDVIPMQKSVFVKDVAEFGLVEYDELGNPILETYEKVNDENLEATRWGMLLGSQVYPALVYKVNEVEGYPHETPVE